MLLNVVGSYYAKFETVQTFSHVQTDAATRNIVGEQCWELLRPYVRSLMRVSGGYAQAIADSFFTDLKSHPL